MEMASGKTGSDNDIYTSKIYSKLKETIEDMAENADLFVHDPYRDFTRRRMLPFDKTMHMALTMGGGSVGDELHNIFKYDADIPTNSAFSQARGKIRPEAFGHLFHSFNNSVIMPLTYEGHRLLATDGSKLNIAWDPEDEGTFFGQSNTKGYNQMHLDALYDLRNHTYVDILVQDGRHAHENKALDEMAARSPISGKTILLADRGYESWNNFASIAQKGWSYLVRAKDISSNGILAKLELPAAKAFDADIEITLTRVQSKETKGNPQKYRVLTGSQQFSFLGKENKFFRMEFRALRIKLDDGSYICIITNLPRSGFPPKKIKKLYSLRWGVETSFRKLKHTIGLSSLHSKKKDFIRQEIYARCTMHNFCELIVLNTVLEEARKSRKHEYQANFSAAVKICRGYLRYFIQNGNKSEKPLVEKFIAKKILPIRPDRNPPRNVRPQSAVCFNYRVA